MFDMPPPAAKVLLDFIRSIEAPRGFGTIFGNNQDKLPKPLTTMTLDEVMRAQPGWTKRYGSSAAGGLQFMRATLKGLKTQMGLSGDELFDATLQEAMGWQLLKRRGYLLYIAGSIDRTEFGQRLAQEWASFPVLAPCKGAHRELKRGDSYYRGDGVNHVLVSAAAVEKVLDRLKRTAGAPADHEPPPERHDEPPAPKPEPQKKLRWSARFWSWLTTGGVATAAWLKESGLLGLDRWVLLALLAVVVAFAIYAIVAMPQVRRLLGLDKA